MPFPLPFQLNQVTSPALDAVNPWQIKSVLKQEENKAGLSKQWGTNSSPPNGSQLYPSRRLSGLKKQCWELIKDKNQRKKSTAQVLWRSHLPGEQVLCCCQVPDIHPCSASMRVTALERSRGKDTIPGMCRARGHPERAQFLGSVVPGDKKAGHNSCDL